jgi:NAD(P)H-hydrate epimerase
MGQSPGTFAVTKWVLANFQGPVVLDADGINLISGHMDLLRERTGITVLTPHDGEFGRLAGEIGPDRTKAAMELAQDSGTVVVLKGHHTRITDGRRCYINPTGNPGMAVGGSGDVLAGITVSLLGQGLAPLDAAACAAWLHGAAGDRCAADLGQYGMLPSDILSVLPRLMK